MNPENSKYGDLLPPVIPVQQTSGNESAVYERSTDLSTVIDYTSPGFGEPLIDHEGRQVNPSHFSFINPNTTTADSISYLPIVTSHDIYRMGTGNDQAKVTAAIRVFRALLHGVEDHPGLHHHLVAINQVTPTREQAGGERAFRDSVVNKGFNPITIGTLLEQVLSGQVRMRQVRVTSGKTSVGKTILEAFFDTLYITESPSANRTIKPSDFKN